jgi:hypothetical protein
MGERKIIVNPKRFKPIRPKGQSKWSAIQGDPRKIKIKGKIHAIFDDLDVAHVPPLPNCYTVTLYPRRGRVYYLKFGTKEELERQRFSADETVIVEGILRCVDGKQIVTNAKRSSEEF